MSRSITSRSSRSSRSIVFGSLSFVAAFVGLVVGAGGCGARGPLDDDGPLSADGGGSADALGDTGTADVVAPTDGPALRDAGGDATSEGGTIIDCGSCLLTSCGTPILTCVQDTGCRTTLQCVATTCLTGGTPNLTCILGCAAGDPTGALQIFQIFQCVTGMCGSQCNSVLGGLVGGLGGAGGGAGGGGGGKPPALPSPGSRGAPLPLELPTASDSVNAAAAAHAEASQEIHPFAQVLYSKWPELSSH